MQDTRNGTSRYKLSFAVIFAPARLWRTRDIFLDFDHPGADRVDSCLPDHVLDFGWKEREGGEYRRGPHDFEGDTVVNGLHCGPGVHWVSIWFCRIVLLLRCMSIYKGNTKLTYSVARVSAWVFYVN